MSAPPPWPAAICAGSWHPGLSLGRSRPWPAGAARGAERAFHPLSRRERRHLPAGRSLPAPPDLARPWLGRGRLLALLLSRLGVRRRRPMPRAAGGEGVLRRQGEGVAPTRSKNIWGWSSPILAMARRRPRLPRYPEIEEAQADIAVNRHVVPCSLFPAHRERSRRNPCAISSIASRPNPTGSTRSPRSWWPENRVRHPPRRPPRRRRRQYLAHRPYRLAEYQSGRSAARRRSIPIGRCRSHGACRRTTRARSPIRCG